MSKSVGKLLGVGNAKTGYYGSEQEVLKFLNDYDTSQVDSAYKNMAQLGNQMSSQLSNRPGYVYSVNGSADAAQRAENAAYQSAVSRLTPQFEDRRRQLETQLQNQGLSVGSEAYQKAMNDLEQQQNDAYTQAAYQSVQQGQNAYTNSLNNQIAAGNFQNSAQMLPINEILSLLSNSKSGYDVAMDKYNVANRADLRSASNSAANADARNSVGWNAVNSAASLAGIAASALFSDEDLKQNIVEVGRLYNGLTVYLYTYRGDNVPHIGLLAQEVAYHRPEAVSVDESGYMKVNYALACM